MITQQQAQDLINQHIKSDVIKLHIREVATIMRAVAKELSENETDWEIVGLLHDLDYEEEKEHWDRQGLTLEKWVREVDSSFPAEYSYAIKSHNAENLGPQYARKSKLDFVLAACDNLSGMIFSTALIYPERKISTLKVENILKKMKNPSFAARVNRRAIYDIEKTGIKLERFIEIGIKALGEIETDLGL